MYSYFHVSFNFLQIPDFHIFTSSSITTNVIIIKYGIATNDTGDRPIAMKFRGCHEKR